MNGYQVDTVLVRVAEQLRDWDPSAERGRLLDALTGRSDYRIAVGEMRAYLIKKGLALLITAMPGLPYIRAAEWFVEEGARQPVGGRVVSRFGLVPLHPYPAHEVPATGVQRTGSAVQVLDYCLSPVDYAPWYRLRNDFSSLRPADWMDADHVHIADAIALLDLPFVEFEIG